MANMFHSKSSKASAACLIVKVSALPERLKMTVTAACNMEIPSFPLLVDEGYLFVEDNGVISYLCVRR